MGSNAGSSIRQAVSSADYVAFGALIREYVEWCRERYRDDPWLVEMAFGYQSLDIELDKLPTAFGPPNGKTLLAIDGDEIQGAVAYRRLSDDVCEMKRMFVPSRFQGRALGRRLCDALIDQASADGFSLMRLDTSRDMAEAISLYRSAGFVACAPYVDYPDRLKPMILFMERSLGAV